MSTPQVQVLTQQQMPSGPSATGVTPIPINIAHALPPMPARGHSSAPKFNASFPRELQRFFSDLENWFTIAQVTDSGLRKQHAVQYVKLDTSDFWKTIPEWTTGTYDMWKDALL